MFFWKKERKVEQTIEEYLQETERCVDSFCEAFDVYFAEGLTDQFHALVEKTHACERVADDRRRDIERKMYDKALIPESRGDILGMLESIDLVPNKCESILYQIWTQNLIVPEQFTGQLKVLVELNAGSHALLCTAMRELFIQVKQVSNEVDLVRDAETQADEIERSLIKAIFDSDIDKVDKILLKELVLEVGKISDRGGKRLGQTKEHRRQAAKLMKRHLHPTSPSSPQD